MEEALEMSTRNILLTLLKKKGRLSVSEMANELNITEMAIRRHINTLGRDGLIESVLVRQAMGRPIHLYSLSAASDALFPKNYDQLALDLLGELAAEDGEARIAQLFDKRKEKLHAKYADRMKGKSFEEKVEELAAIQNANGYMVTLTACNDGKYKLEEMNCPITHVASQYQEACSCELALFRDLLAADVDRVECLTKGGRKCTYIIQPFQ